MAFGISTILCVFILLVTINLVFPQTRTDDCPLDIQYSSNINYTNCTQGDWGGLLENNCCKYVFNRYLFALARRANQTGQIFLNSTQQRTCLDSVNSRCGIEKLTREDSTCSKYSVSDVENKMGNVVRKLEQDCKLLHSGDESDETCGACLRRWEETDLSTSNDLCMFSVIVVLASTRADGEKWIKSLYKCLGRQSPNDQGEERKDDKRERRKRKLAIGFLIGGLVGTICILVVATWFICWKSRKPKVVQGKSDLNYSSMSVSSPRKITLKDVYFATNDLNESNFIGQGIAGKVYRGVMLNGKHIAVKHIANDGQKETFVREVQSLSHVKHPNLVTLIGHCEREYESFLIYELCHNGNLSEWLFGKEKNLNWMKRLEIALDCAKGLLFLHTYPQGCIVHRDIKPTNILICADYQGKLSDFGLSKVMNIGQSFVSSEVRGTFGYVDPEYQQNHRVNSSGDVYSFGIVLLQLLSGKRVINFDIEEPIPIGKMAKALTKSGNTFEFADPKLNGEYSDEAFELVLNLALSCSRIKQKRPNMKQVVASLEHDLDLSATMKIPSYLQDKSLIRQDCSFLSEFPE